MPQIFSIGGIAHNKSQIPMHILNDIISVIEVRTLYICSEWKNILKRFLFIVN